MISDFAGNALSQFTEHIPAHGRVSLPLKDKLNSLLPIQGSITVTPKQRATVGAQLSITMDGRDGRSSDLEEEFVMLNPSLKNEFHALGMDVSGEPVTALRSLSSGTQRVVITCVDESAGVKSTSLLLGPSSTAYVQGCSGAAFAIKAEDLLRPKQPLRGERVVGVSVSSDGMPGELAAYGFAHAGGGYESLPFSQASSGQQEASVFPGIPIGSVSELGGMTFEPEIGLSNFGTAVKSAKIFYSSGSQTSRQLLSTVKIAPYSSLKVPLPGFSGAPALKNSFVIVSDNSDGQVISRVRSVSATDPAIAAEMLVQDRDKAYKWRAASLACRFSDRIGLASFQCR